MGWKSGNNSDNEDDSTSMDSWELEDLMDKIKMQKEDQKEKK